MIELKIGGKGVHNQPERFLVDCHRIGKLRFCYASGMAQPLGGTEQGVVVRRNAAKNGIGKVNAAVVKAVGCPPIQGVVGSQQIQRSIVAGGISAFYKAKSVVKDFHSGFVFFICPEGAGKTVNQSGQTGANTACGWNQRRNCFPVENDTGFDPLRIIGTEVLSASISSKMLCA